MPTTILTEVPPIRGDETSLETWYETARYTSCDLCYETAVEDIWAAGSGFVPEDQWRRFYEVLGEGGLIVCENCLPNLENSE